MEDNNLETEYENDTYSEPSNDPPVSGYALASFVCSCSLIIVAVFGLMGNIISYWVFAKSSVIRSINILLAAQAVTDIVLLLIATPLFASMGMLAYNPTPTLVLVINVLIVYTYPIAMMAQTATVWATVVITCERYLAVCKPFKAMVICTTQNAKTSLVVVFSVAILYNVCRFWEYILNGDNELEPLLRANGTYMQVYYNWLYFWVIFFVPLIALITLNGLIIRTIYRNQRQTYLHVNRQLHREYQTSLMMVFITCTFLFCNFLAFLLKILDNVCLNTTDASFCEEPFYQFLVDFNNLLVEINSSIPFLVYLLFSRCFRVRVSKMLKKYSRFFRTFSKPFKNSRNASRRSSAYHYRFVYSNHTQSTRLISVEGSKC